MFTAIAHTSALHAFRLSFTIEYANNYLETHGQFDLGTFLETFNSGPLVGASKEELAALYEPALLSIAAAHGPLIAAYPSDAETPRWGYAGLREDEPAREEEESHFELMTRRITALGTGHPDQKAWNAGLIPKTFWMCEDCVDD